MISLFLKSIPLILTLHILVMAISYNLLTAQDLDSLSKNEKTHTDTTSTAPKCADEKNKKAKFKVNVAYPIMIGVASAVLLASISYKLEDDPTPGKESFHSKGTSAIVGAIVGFIAGFFISGAVMELRAKRAAKRETQQYNIYQLPSISFRENVRAEPYLKSYGYGNQCGINLKFQF